jgi:hypothetical protein
MGGSEVWWLVSAALYSCFFLATTTSQAQPSHIIIVRRTRLVLSLFSLFLGGSLTILQYFNLMGKRLLLVIITAPNMIYINAHHPNHTGYTYFGSL